MENNKEIEKTLNSLEGIQKPEANPFLYEKVMHRLSGKEAIVVAITPRVVWQAAACFAFLIALNVFVLIRSNSNENLQSENNNPMTQEYFSYLNNDQF
jgi:hypothetical protein